MLIQVDRPASARVRSAQGQCLKPTSAGATSSPSFFAMKTTHVELVSLSIWNNHREFQPGAEHGADSRSFFRAHVLPGPGYLCLSDPRACAGDDVIHQAFGPESFARYTACQALARSRRQRQAVSSRRSSAPPRCGWPSLMQSRGAVPS